MDNDKFIQRMKEHDEFENKIMDILRPYTTRKHLPDRFVSFGDKLFAWDAKTTIFVEDKSHNEYFRIQNENNIPVFIVYQDGDDIRADWISKLTWSGPYPPSKNSTCMDNYYRISRGRTLDEFIEAIKEDNP